MKVNQPTIMSRAIFLHKIVAAICLTSLLSVCTGSFTKQVLANESTNSDSREGLPGRRVGGGTRGESLPIVALVPETSEGLTTLANPTFFFYVPPTASPQMAEFVLNDESGETVYEKKITLDANSGVLEISILADAKIKSLEIGKNYRWYFAVVPNAENRSNDIYVTGWIKRVQPSAEVVSQLKNLPPLDRITVYTRNNLWYDAVATLAELRRSRPNDPAVQTRWRELLRSVNLDDHISQQPFINYQVPARSASVVSSDSQQIEY